MEHAWYALGECWGLVPGFEALCRRTVCFLVLIVPTVPVLSLGVSYKRQRTGNG